MSVHKIERIKAEMEIWRSKPPVMGWASGQRETGWWSASRSKASGRKSFRSMRSRPWMYSTRRTF